MPVRMMTLWEMAIKLRDEDIKAEDVLIIDWTDKESHQLGEQSNMTFEQILDWFKGDAVTVLVKDGGVDCKQ